MVPRRGFEPLTHGLEGRCSILLSYRGSITCHRIAALNPLSFGRGREIRTPDILLPKQARYQTALCPDGSGHSADSLPDPALMTGPR